MAKLTKNHLSDPDEGISEALIEQIDAKYLATLTNLEQTHPKVLVVFSGGNAVGKSVLAQKIAKEFGALHLENDTVKEIIKGLKPELDRKIYNTLTWQYMMNLYKRLGTLTSNGFLVRDGVIDWYFDRILPLFEAQGYQLYVIAYDISAELNKTLIERRGDKPTVSVNTLIKQIDQHKIHQKRFRKVYTPNIVLTEDTLFDHDFIVGELKKYLKL